jgi:DNA processing protein
MMGAPAERWVIARGEAGYPDCLEECPRPPKALYGFGDPSLLRPGLAVVGARRATPYGLACTRMFAGWAAAAGVVVVSGAAAGCDAAAHAAALEADGPTVAVLGCGADVDYPPGSTSLLATMRKRAAVISELEWGSQPTRWTFPERNRIIAALSRAVLVVEASLPSGTLVTADHALDANREVWAVPGSVFFEGSRGCNRLIRQGATAVTDCSELAEELAALGFDVRPSASDTPRVGTRDPVRAAVAADPTRPDDLARHLGLDIVEVARSLAALEREGLVARYPDGRYGPR